MDDEFESTIETPKPKKRRKKMSLEKRRKRIEEKGFTTQEIAIVKANYSNPKATLVEKGKAAGVVGSNATISKKVHDALERVKEKTSQNQRFQELLRLKGAGAEELADVIAGALKAETPFRARETFEENGKLITKEITKMFPDHRARLDAVRLSTEAQQLMPDKKVVIEEFKYEMKVQAITHIKNNPEVLQGLQKLLEEKKKAEAIDAEVVDV